MRHALLASGLIGLAAAANPLIAGLGSSYAQGPGLTKPIGELLKEKLENKHGITYDFTNIAVGGTVLGDIPKNQAPKPKGKKPDLIYLVSGGNDLDYVHCLGDPRDTVCSNPVGEDEFKKRYASALDAIVEATDKDTRVPIYAITYMTAVDVDSKCGSDNKECPLDNDEFKEVKGLHDDVVDWTVHALSDWRKIGNNAQYQVKLVPMRYHSIGHHVGSQKPWMNGASVPPGAGGISWHPNDAGAQAIADYLFADFAQTG